jgi:hypothetical protein
MRTISWGLSAGAATAPLAGSAFIQSPVWQTLISCSKPWVCVSLTPQRLMKLLEKAQTGASAESPGAILDIAVESLLCALCA